jgi:hypothetical protein
MPKNMRPYDDYELGNARLAAQSMRPASQEDYMPDMNRVRSIASQTQDYNDYEADNARQPMVYNGPDMTDYNDYEAGNAQMAARSIADMARMGRGTDTMMAHVTPGDYVIPRAIVEKDPAILSRIKRSFEEEGADYRDHYVGGEYSNINPETGLPEFKFLKKLRNIALPVLGAIAGSAVPGLGTALGASLGAAAGKKLTGASFKDAAITGATTYAGGKLLGSAGSGDVAGKLTTNAATRGVGEGLASGSLGGSIGQAVGGINVGQLSGALQGQSIGNMVSGAMVPMEMPDTGSVSIPQENLDIGTPAAMALPGSLSNLGGLNDIQQTSQIATKGSEGVSGVSREGQDYFVNQLRRRLTTQPTSGLLPIEGTYLNRLGVNFQPGNTRSILEGIARGGLNA